MGWLGLWLFRDTFVESAKEAVVDFWFGWLKAPRREFDPTDIEL